jgi:hypothetical protein
VTPPAHFLQEGPDPPLPQLKSTPQLNNEWQAIFRIYF